MRETSQSIAQWAVETFGPLRHPYRGAVRANEEMAELLTKVASGSGQDVPGECADVVICLARLCDVYGVDLFEEVDRKMAVNRARNWKRDGTGCGYHT